MCKHSFRETLRISITSSALVLALSGFIFGQDKSAPVFPSMVTSPTQAQPVEIASASALPMAPSSVFFDAVPAATPAAPLTPAPFVTTTKPVKRSEKHAFWDRENSLLFAGVGAAATADFFTTRANLASGGKELNPITRIMSGSTPGLAANFALEASGVMAISYLFHRTGHHELERLTSVLNIGGSVGAVAYGQTHR
jgi:hypothetical protein